MMEQNKLNLCCPNPKANQTFVRMRDLHAIYKILSCFFLHRFIFAKRSERSCGFWTGQLLEIFENFQNALGNFWKIVKKHRYLHVYM